MTRPVDPRIKPALLQSIIDYLLDKPLTALTFRGLAAALGVSTTVFVYHFGTRAELIRQIIEAIAVRQRGFETVLDPNNPSVDLYIEGLRAAFAQSLLPRNVALQRLEFEAQMLEALEPDRETTRSAHQALQDRESATLVALGMPQSVAEDEARFVLDAFYGVQIGLVINGDTARAQAAFDRIVNEHHERLRPQAHLES